MAVLVEVPLFDVKGGLTILAEGDVENIPKDLLKTHPNYDLPVTGATTSLTKGLEVCTTRILQILKKSLDDSDAQQVTIEFGLKFGGPDGFVVAREPGHATFKIKATWNLEDPRA